MIYLIISSDFLDLFIRYRNLHFAKCSSFTTFFWLQFFLLPFFPVFPSFISYLIFIRKYFLSKVCNSFHRNEKNILEINFKICATTKQKKKRHSKCVYKLASNAKVVRYSLLQPLKLKSYVVARVRFA